MIIRPAQLAGWPYCIKHHTVCLYVTKAYSRKLRQSERNRGRQGVEDYEPRVVHQLLDFMYAHVSGVLQDAEVGLISSTCLVLHLPGQLVLLVHTCASARKPVIDHESDGLGIV